MRRSDAVRLVVGAAASIVAGCSSDTPACSPVAATAGSASKPTSFGVTLYPQDPAGRDVSLLVGCGGTLARTGVTFGSYSYTDALLAAAAQRGMRVILISPYASQPVDVNSYASSCAAVHARYAQYNPIWEIWNEPNLQYYWGADPNVKNYTALAIATAKVLRAAGASDVWSGGTSGVDSSWTKQMVSLGAFDVMNGCAVHVYDAGCLILEQFNQLLPILPSGIQIHTTETCIPSTQDQVNFLEQMWYVHRSLGIPTMIWCEMRDGNAGYNGAYTLPYGLVTTDYVLKPSYYAAQSLTKSSMVSQVLRRKQ
jgi:hypothetical protein